MKNATDDKEQPLQLVNYIKFMNKVEPEIL